MNSETKCCVDFNWMHNKPSVQFNSIDLLVRLPKRYVSILEVKISLSNTQFQTNFISSVGLVIPWFLKVQA